MTMLAIEFSSVKRSVALARAGQVLAEVSEIGGRETHAFRMMEQALAAAKVRRQDIEIIAVGLGPGSYSGIRVALAMAQGWQLATGVKLLGLSSVECLAAQAQAEKMFGRIFLVVDAQRGEFYQGIFEVAPDRLMELETLKIVPASAVAARLHEGERVAGPEATRWFQSARDLFPSAARLVQIAAGRKEFIPGQDLEPVYLRAAGFLKVAAQKTR